MLKWIENLVARVPEDWKPELNPMGDGDKALAVPDDLIKAYRAGMWADEQADEINDVHALCHEDARFDGTDINPTACAEAKEIYTRHKTCASLLQEAVRQEIRERLGLKQEDRVILTTEGMVVEAPPPENGIADLLEALGGRVSVLRI